jgi:agmatinase
MTLRLWLVAFLVVVGRTWEFPPAALIPQHGSQRPLPLDGDDDDVDIVSGSQFHGLKTFANLPYLNCFSDQETAGNKYDIAIMGAPFDTVCWLVTSTLHRKNV